MPEKKTEKKIVLFLCPRCQTENSNEDDTCRNTDCGAKLKLARELAETLELGQLLLHPKPEKTAKSKSALEKFFGGESE